MPEQIAKLNFLRITPRKVRAVANLLRGLSVNEAEAELLSQRRRAARSLLKLLRSAVQDAKNNQRLDSSKLYIKNLRVDQGPMLKRYLPRARGSASPIQKKMSHITLVLAENQNLPKPRFSIVVKKKAKLPKKETKAGKPTKSKADKEEGVVTPKSSRPGFFQRVFRRKSI